MSDVVRARKIAEARYWRAHAARVAADLITLPKKGHRYFAYEDEATRASELADAIEAEIQETKPQLPVGGSPPFGTRPSLRSICAALNEADCAFPRCACPRSPAA